MKILKKIVKIIDDKKGENINVIDISKVNPLANYFVICSTNNDTQSFAIAHSIEKELIKHNLPFHHSEGLRGDRRWVLVDAMSVIIHIFINEERQKYDIDKLWSDQPNIPLSTLL